MAYPPARMLLAGIPTTTDAARALAALLRDDYYLKAADTIERALDTGDAHVGACGGVRPGCGGMTTVIPSSRRRRRFLRSEKTTPAASAHHSRDRRRDFEVERLQRRCDGPR